MSSEPVSVATCHAWLRSGEAVILDVRTEAEFASEHIAGAVLFTPGMPDGLAARYPGRRLVFQCAAGTRSRNACNLMAQHHPSLTLYNLEGGINAWKQAGFETVKGTRRLLPLDRQVQLTIGILLLAATLAGRLWNPDMHLLALLVGAGLTFAGLTGFCGLARLLARMPWNRA